MNEMIGKETKEEEIKKRGRKTNAERLRMERCWSTGNFIEMNEKWKRKREMIEEKEQGETGGEEKEVTKTRKMQESPGKEKQEKSKIERLITEMKEECKTGMQETRSDMKKKGREVREEIERLREEMKRGEEKWRREREEIV